MCKYCDWVTGEKSDFSEIQIFSVCLLYCNTSIASREKNSFIPYLYPPKRVFWSDLYSCFYSSGEMYIIPPILDKKKPPLRYVLYTLEKMNDILRCWFRKCLDLTWFEKSKNKVTFGCSTVKTLIVFRKSDFCPHMSIFRRKGIYNL